MQSFNRLLGRTIIDGVDEPSIEEVCNADFALVSHGTEADPKFR